MKYPLNVNITVPSAHSTGNYKLTFHNYDELLKIGFLEKDKKVGMFFGGVFYPIDSIRVSDDSESPDILEYKTKNKLNKKVYKTSIVAETENFYVIKKKM